MFVRISDPEAEAFFLALHAHQQRSDVMSWPTRVRSDWVERVHKQYELERRAHEEAWKRG